MHPNTVVLSFCAVICVSLATLTPAPTALLQKISVGDEIEIQVAECSQYCFRVLPYDVHLSKCSNDYAYRWYISEKDSENKIRLKNRLYGAYLRTSVSGTWNANSKNAASSALFSVEIDDTGAITLIDTETSVCPYYEYVCHASAGLKGTLDHQKCIKVRFNWKKDLTQKPTTALPTPTPTEDTEAPTPAPTSATAAPTLSPLREYIIEGAVLQIQPKDCYYDNMCLTEQSGTYHRYDIGLDDCDESNGRRQFWVITDVDSLNRIRLKNNETGYYLYNNDNDRLSKGIDDWTFWTLDINSDGDWYDFEDDRQTFKMKDGAYCVEMDGCPIHETHVNMDDDYCDIDESSSDMTFIWESVPQSEDEDEAIDTDPWYVFGFPAVYNEEDLIDVDENAYEYLSNFVFGCMVFLMLCHIVYILWCLAKVIRNKYEKEMRFDEE